MEEKQTLRERCVYGIFSAEGTVRYIGQCYVSGLRQRWWRHRRHQEVTVNFQKWKWLKENPEAYIAIIQGSLWTRQESNDAEKNFIAQHANLLNLTPGGDYNPMLEEDEEKRKIAIEKIRFAARRRRHSDKTKEKIRQYVTGKPGPWTKVTMSIETRQKISEFHKGKQWSKGRKLSEETKKKISNSMKKAKRRKIT